MCRFSLPTGRASLKCCDWNARRSEVATPREIEYAITSLAPDRAGAVELLALWRGHWGIENREHWIRDTHWREDRCRVRLSRGAHNLAAFRNAAINLLRLAKTTNLAAALRENAYRVEPSSPGSVYSNFD